MSARSVTPTRPKPRAAHPPAAVSTSKYRDLLTLAEERGLLSGQPTLVVRGRIPLELVKQARHRTGITSDTELLKAALANIALADDYWEWFRTQRATVPPDLDLEF